jgi:hypothetical protein
MCENKQNLAKPKLKTQQPIFFIKKETGDGNLVFATNYPE